MNPLLQNALAAHQAGRFSEAEAAYRSLLLAFPDEPDGTALLAVLLTSLKRAEEALPFARRAVALDPSAALFFFYLGNTLSALDKKEEARGAFLKALELEPRMVEAAYNLGNLLQEMSDLDGAKQAYLLALRVSPSHALALNNLAVLYEKEGCDELALKTAHEAVVADPACAPAWRSLSSFADRAGDFALAEEAGRKAVALSPEDPEAWLALGVALNRQLKNDEALLVYKKIIALAPEGIGAWDNLAQTLQLLGRDREAEAAYRKCVEIAGEAMEDKAVFSAPEASLGAHHWHLALIELLLGRWTIGFARYRARFVELSGFKRPHWERPLWNGEPLRGKTLLVYDEQGFGDTLMLSRFLPLLKEAGARVWVLVGKPLAPLFRLSELADRVFERGEPLEDGFDFYASFFDLPFRLGATPETLPGAEGVLRDVFCAQQDAGEEKSAKEKRGLAVGVVWAGAPGHKHDARRSIPLADFASLFDVEGVRFFSLTRDRRAGDAVLLRTLPVQDLSAQLTDFVRSAEIMQKLDLVITVDTSTAHLAGSLGIPVWVLLPTAPDWRWLLDREDSPWYRSARLFRQKKAGAWGEVLGRVRAALAAAR